MITRGKTCVYCGAPATSRDHVPPKCLFPQPLPKNMITVPSCEACNLGSSGDDEYLRNMLVSRHDTQDNPSAKLVRESFLRSLKKPEKLGMARAFVNSQCMIDMLSPGGIYLGKASGYDVDLQRLNSVVKRVVLGLRHRFLKAPMPPGFEMFVRCISNAEPEDRRDFADMFISIVRGGRIFRMGNEVLRLAFQSTSDRPDVSLWAMQFYGTESFICLCGPEDLKDHQGGVE